MSITSFAFLIFCAITLLIYYMVPGRFQWVILLVASICYYLTSGNAILILYPVAAVTICYGGIRAITYLKEHDSMLEAAGRKPQKQQRNVLIAVILLNVAVLVLLKYINFGINTVNGIASWFHTEGPLLDKMNWLVPLGISYYSLTLIGYVADVYFGIAGPQKNIGRLALYGMYFPIMTSGPILRYREDGEQFFLSHRFDYRQVTQGMQRMLWGFFKKLVISERMAVIVSSVYGDYRQFPGIYIWIGTFCFAFQLYTDFSGCMDIMLGLSQTFGLKLPENFERPFFSKSISEYWRRWHMTLGIWMKEYIFYPVLRSAFFTKLSKDLRKRLGKKRGKQLTTFAGMFLLWFAVGIWHGGDWKYVIGSGVLHWFYIVSGELLEPFWGKIMDRLNINPQSAGLKIWRILRTFLLVNIGFVFFRADSVKDAMLMLWSAVTVWNPGALFSGAVAGLGLDWIEWIIAIVSLLLLLAVSLSQRSGSVRHKIAARKLPVRWLIWYALLFYVILLGYYGPGYSAADFIYKGF